MKKLLGVILVLMLVVPSIGNAFESEVKAGDIILLESDSFSLGGYELWVPLFKAVCGMEHLPAHAEVVVDDDGTSFSSIQPNGTTYSTVGKRLQQFGKGILLRLKEHFESRLTALEKATDLAAKTLDKRLEGMNEFRETLRDQASKFVTDKEVDAKPSKYETVASTRAGVAILVSILALLVGIVGTVILMLK